MVAIKQLGTNGGGWFGPNSSVPLENPTPLANVIETASIMLIPVALLVAIALIANRRRLMVGIGVVMLAFSLVSTSAVVMSERMPNAALAGLYQTDAGLQGNLEGKSGKAVEIAGSIDTLLLDKTGTITLGDRRATEFAACQRVRFESLRDVAFLASLEDPTPEGRSIVALASAKGVDVQLSEEADGATFIAFSAETRLSGVDLTSGKQLRKGAPNAIAAWVATQGGVVPGDFDALVARISRDGATPIAVAEGQTLLGVIALSDVIKEGIAEKFAELRALGIKTVMITGDNPITASAIAATAGVDDYIAEATPERKLALIREEQASGRLVAMVGDGTNDAPALAQADLGLAMNSGTQAAREAANMVDLDSDPGKLISAVEIGKQLLITRGGRLQRTDHPRADSLCSARSIG